LAGSDRSGPEAAFWQERGLNEKPGATWIYRTLVAIYALLGRDAEARAGLARMRAEYPDLTIAKIADALPFRQAAQDRFAEGLKKAGMPE
jgi:adenylate cyclase